MSESSHFPPVYAADEHGLLALGGRLNPEWLEEAYHRGVFPWPMVDGDLEILAWFAPDPRAVLPLDALHVSRRLARRIRRGEFEPTCDRDFAGVVAGCRAPRGTDAQTWITSSMASAYQRLHELGHAHSVEVWCDGRLAGGVYGVSWGAFFAGESMFHRRRDASTAALYYLVEHLRMRGYELLDVQESSPHLERLGVVDIPRAEYGRRLRKAIRQPVAFGDKLERA